MTDLAERHDGSLTGSEQARLFQLEALIERGVKTFVQVGSALMEIRDERLYRETHETFETYCEERWSLRRAHAYRLIDGARVAEVVSPVGDIPNERQARELARLLDEPEALRDAWQQASTNGTPTALKVREVVQRALPPVSPEAREKQRRWAATINVLDGLAHFDREPLAEQADAEAALIDQDVAATRGQTITPDRLRNAAAWASLLADALERRTA